MPQCVVVTATTCVKKYRDNEDAESACAEQARTLYNEKLKEFHKVLIIVLGSALFIVFLVPLCATIVKGGNLNSLVVDVIETKQESTAYPCRIS